MKNLLHLLIAVAAIVLLAMLPVGCGQPPPEPVDDHDHAADQGQEHQAEDDHGHSHGPALESGHTEDDGHDHGSDESASLPSPYGIEVERIFPSLYSDTIKIPGIVAQAPDRRAEVSASTMVRVAALDLPPKSTVRAGQRLAVLELVDPEARQLQMRAVEIRADILAATTERDRTRAYLDVLLAQDEPIEVEIRRVQADLAVLEARSASRKSALEASLASLKVVGLSDGQLRELEEKGAVSTRIEVFAPRLDGTPEMEVSERPVAVGETLAAGSTIYSLVALDRLLAIGEAFEADLADVRRAAREDFPVTLFFPAEGRTVPGLRIAAVEGTLDGANRMTHFLVPFPNKRLSEKTVDGARYLDWENRVGSRIQILVATGQTEEHYVIPSTALVREAGRSALFIRRDGAYIQMVVPVETLDAGRAVLPLDCGISPGDEVVVKGALQLKLALQEGSGSGTATDGSDHGHQH